MRRALATLGCLLALAGCQLRAGAPTVGILGGQDGINRTIPLIQGTLVDASGHPVAGAAVRAYVPPYQVAGLAQAATGTIRATTDPTGHFTLSDPPAGTLAVEAVSGSAKALRRDVQVASGQSVDLGTMTVLPTGGFDGRLATTTGRSLLGADVFIPGTDYLAKSTASGDFAIAEVPVGTYSIAAMAPSFVPKVVDGVEITSAATTHLGDLPLVLDAPVLESLSQTSGGPGALITLRGSNFGAGRSTVLEVRFGDTLATTLHRVSDTEISVTVPVGAGSSGVTVRSNGIASEALAFQVVSRIALGVSNVGLFADQAFTWSLTAFDGAGEAIAHPLVSWQLGDPTLGALDAASTTFTASHSYGVSTLIASSGTVKASAWVGVTPFTLTTLYGVGLPGVSGDGGQASEAQIGSPMSLAKDSQGNVYLTQRDDAVIRVVAPDGTITHFAGNGVNGIQGDDGPALQAQIGTGCSLELDPGNRLWFSDAVHSVVRFIPLDDHLAPDFRRGYVYRAAGTGLAGYDGSGLAGQNSRLSYPSRLATSPDGMLVADSLNHRIRLITPDFRLVDVLGTGSGDRFEADVPEAQAAVYFPTAMARDSQGNLVVSTLSNVLFWCKESGTYFGQSRSAGRVYSLLSARTGFVGDGVAGQTCFSAIKALQVSPEGACYFTDYPGLIRRLTSAGRVETVSGKAIEAASLMILGFDATKRNPLEISMGNPSDLRRDGSSWLVASTDYHRILRLSL